MSDVDEVVVLERELLDPVCRADAGRVGELLAGDFVEIGRSGRVWQRDEIIAELVADPTMGDVSVGVIAGEVVGPGLVMVRYVTERHGVVAQRTGWWRSASPASPARSTMGTQRSVSWPSVRTYRS